MFSAVVFVLVLFTFYSYTQTNNLIQATSSLSHSHKVSLTVQRILGYIFELETNSQGFLLTQDKVRLSDRDKVIVKLNIQLLLLSKLIEENPIQKQHLNSLNKFVEMKLEKLRKISQIEVKRYNYSLFLLNMREGILLEDSIKNVSNRIIETENDLSKNLSKRTQMQFYQSPKILIFLFSLAIIILIFSYGRISTSLKYSSELQHQLTRKNAEMENGTAELLKANNKLEYQNKEKEKREEELIIANNELAFQNAEKEKRADELIIANRELIFQNKEREKRANELWIANRELEVQNEEKAKIADKLDHLNKELELFVNISSHDLQEPMRKLQIAASRFSEKDMEQISVKGREQFRKMQEASVSMQTLMEDLLAYSKINSREEKLESIELHTIIEEVIASFEENIEESNAIVVNAVFCQTLIHPFQFRQMIQNLMSNSFKFARVGTILEINMDCDQKKGAETGIEQAIHDRTYCHIKYRDSGIGFDPLYKERIFQVFQRLHGKDVYKGNGIGLAIVKKIVEQHAGFIFAHGELNQGAQFDIYLPILNL